MENFPKQSKDIKLQTNDALQTPVQIPTKKTAPKHFAVKINKPNTKRKIFQTAEKTG